MNGLLVVNKPKNYTSRDVINKLNRIFSYKSIGHTGTLDPLATGVLVCLFGKYTKLTEDITSLSKEYIAEIKLGIKTDTDDITGTCVKVDKKLPSYPEVIKAFNTFPRTYMQTVPIYSAVKVNGKKLYEYARANMEVELPKREVHIYSLELIDYKDDIITFKTQVSKGTYIRSLIIDILNTLNVLGTMNNLTRTQQGGFTLDKSYTLEDIKNNNYVMQNIKDFLPYPVISLEEDLYRKVKNGAKIPNAFNIKDKVIFTFNNEDIAIYENINGTLKSYLML